MTDSTEIDPLKVLRYAGYGWAADEIDHLQVLLGEVRQALEYIHRPTMALPGDRDAADFARTDAREEDVRAALATVIGMAVASRAILDRADPANEWVRKAVIARSGGEGDRT